MEDDKAAEFLLEKCANRGGFYVVILLDSITRLLCRAAIRNRT